MRIPLTRYGLPQVLIYPVVAILAMVLLPLAAHPTTPVWLIRLLECLLLIILVWAVSFFRDPHRNIPQDKNVLLAPADGTITDIETVDEPEFIGGRALRIGIFLSIFNVHINRSPCDAKVERIIYKQGSFENAMNPASGRVNESNNLYIFRSDPPQDKLIVRQISGAIARRIVCAAKEGTILTGGERFGMIKFGSRTELYAPSRSDVVCVVRIGDKVKAGLTPILRYEGLSGRTHPGADK